MSKEFDGVVNLSDRQVRRELMTLVGTLDGLYEVRLKPRKRTRSLDQNAYYWAAFISPFLAWLRETEGDPTIDKEQAHIALKCAVLGTRTIANKETGDVIEIPPPTRSMNTDEFTVYLDLAAKWLAEWCNIEVLDASMFYEKEK